MNKGGRPKRTHCKRGHEFTEENVYYRPDKPGVRNCRICRDRHNGHEERAHVATNHAPDAYDDQEAIRLHRQRLVEGYAAACGRLPRGFTMSFAVWIQTIGDGGTCWADRHWIHASAALAVEWRES